MRPVQFHAQTLVDLLRQQQVASMPEMLEALGAASSRTIARKLTEVPHLTSYSHGGRFYALRETARFDLRGLWFYHGIRFSTHGSLLATAEHFVRESARGFLVDELDALLGVATGNALRQLARSQRLTRVKLGRCFLYVALDPVRARQQRRARRPLTPAQPADAGAAHIAPDAPDAPDPTQSQPPSPQPAKTVIIPTFEQVSDAQKLFLTTLDEQQRRLFAGLSSLKDSLAHGRGGDNRVAAELGIHPSTVARGRRELITGDVQIGRVRRPGGGRKSAERKPCADATSSGLGPP